MFMQITKSTYNHILFSYFFLDEKVRKKSRLISLEGLALAIRRMLQVISSQARSFLCILRLLAALPSFQPYRPVLLLLLLKEYMDILPAPNASVILRP
jgi:hypothetical protein